MEGPAEKSRTDVLDSLRIYGFSFDYPAAWRLEFDPKFTREEGSLAIKSPSKSVIFVSWGDLHKVVRKLPTAADHSKYSMERAKKNTRGTLNIVEQREMRVNGHSAAFGHAKVETPGILVGAGKRSQEIESLHLHCENTSRYFVVYTSLEPEGPKGRERHDTLLSVISTFKCH